MRRTSFRHSRLRRRRLLRTLLSGPLLVVSVGVFLFATPALAETPTLTRSAVPGGERSVSPSPSPASPTPAPSGTADEANTAPAAPSGKATGPLGASGDWRLKFGDEFSGQQLNVDKWRPNWLGEHNDQVTKPFNHRELSCYHPAQVSVADGSARLQAVKRSCKTISGKTYPYRSGIIQSSADYRFTYGFAEARMYLPPSTDAKTAKPGSCGPNWAAFWLNGQRWPTDGEIDVMECLGEDNVTWNYHSDGGLVPGRPKGWHGGMPGGGGWHVFGVDWTPGGLTYYFDGKPVGRVTGDVTRAPHYLIANLSISGTKIKAPQTVKIDYIRVWRRR